MNQRDLWWIAGGALGAIVYWHAWDVDGSGEPLTERRSVKGVTEIEVRGDVHVVLEVGDEPSVEVSGDDNIVPLVETRVDGERLVIEATRDIEPDLPLRVRVTMADVTAIEGSGAVEIDVEGFDNDALDIDVSGAAEVRARGRTERLRVEVSGSGEADVSRVVARRVELDVSGAAEVEVGEPEELDVEVSGAAKVRYAGDPRIEQDISGAAEIVRR